MEGLENIGYIYNAFQCVHIDLKLVLYHDDLTLAMVKLSPLKINLHAYTYTHTDTHKTVQKGVNPDTLSEMKNTERVFFFDSRIEEIEQNSQLDQRSHRLR